MLAKKVTVADVELAAGLVTARTNGDAEPRLPAPVPAEPAPPPVPINPGPTTLAEKVYALTAAVCHWPLGNPGDQDFCFCSAPVVTPPYCPRHYAQAITPADVHGGPSGRRLLPSANINRDETRTPTPAGAN